MSTATTQEPRTATVRDLRNRFAAVARWVEDGEKVTITRHGAAFATLAPAPATKKLGKPDWAARFKRRPPIGKKLTPEETQAFYDEMKGVL
ncbi:MAG: type II toxin-antitoxin system prevent-host-death family antitoxin [Verrucomicrobiae bacterium]